MTSPTTTPTTVDVVSPEDFAMIQAELRLARLDYDVARTRMDAASAAFFAAQCGVFFGTSMADYSHVTRHHCIQRKGHPVADGHASGTMTEHRLSGLTS